MRKLLAPPGHSRAVGRLLSEDGTLVASEEDDAEDDKGEQEYHAQEPGHTTKGLPVTLRHVDQAGVTAGEGAAHGDDVRALEQRLRLLAEQVVEQRHERHAVAHDVMHAHDKHVLICVGLAHDGPLPHRPVEVDGQRDHRAHIFLHSLVWAQYHRARVLRCIELHGDPTEIRRDFTGENRVLLNKLEAPLDQVPERDGRLEQHAAVDNHRVLLIRHVPHEFIGVGNLDERSVVHRTRAVIFLAHRVHLGVEAPCRWPNTLHREPRDEIRLGGGPGYGGARSWHRRHRHRRDVGHRGRGLGAVDGLLLADPTARCVVPPRLRGGGLPLGLPRVPRVVGLIGVGRLDPLRACDPRRGTRTTKK
mmetsp:Transcript_44433/g.121093  ORF Transcript_44433/g.121093 Transcript_44433/m.121093 type:complete len:361 (+) Transcript_44433:771-1853(+)